MDNKVKSSVLFLFLLFLILTTKNNVAFISLFTLSLTTIFYNLKKGVSIYLVLGFTGIYISTLLRQSVERFQDSTSTSTVAPTTTSTYTPTTQCSDDNRKNLSVSLKNFKELGFLFDSLFRIDETRMRTILKENCITDIFSLKNYIEYYRNLDESDIKTNNWAYSDKALSLSKLIPIYLLSPEDMVTVINKENISFDQLNEDKTIRNTLFGVESYHTLAMEYYFNEKKLTKKHYKIITTLHLEKKLPESIAENLETLLVTPRYYDYAIKDIIGIVILFEHLGYINNTELTEDWATDDPNGDEWVKIKLIQIDLTHNMFLRNNLFNEYKLKHKIKKFISTLEEEERERIARETIDFSQPFSEKKQQEVLFSARNNIKDEKIQEYHSELVEKMEDNGDDIMSDVTIDFNNVDKLIKKSNSTLTGVIDEIQILYTNVSNTNYAPGSSFNNMLTRYLVFVKELMNILTRDQRLLFVGLFIMILAVIFSLIEVNLY
jgi:hypothetical protein